MTASAATRWAVLGTAKIASSTFIPALAEAGGGRAVLVAGRDAERTAAFAREYGVERALTGYAAAIEAAGVDAVYVALPNALHARWTIAALRAGRAVLTEKPACVDAAQTARVLDVARKTPGPLWEAFVFVFQPQLRRVLDLIGAGAIGEPREIQAQFHAPLDDAGDIRFRADLGGGVLPDLAVYPIRLARLIFAAEATGARASRVLGPGGVEVESWGSVDFPRDRRLLFSASFRGRLDSAARIVGTKGVIEISHPYAPGPVDIVRISTDTGTSVERLGSTELPFTDQLRHIHAALRGDEPPRHLAVDDAYGTAAVLDAVRRSAAANPAAVSRSGS